MFERFTRDAREVVVGAQQEATRLHSGRIGTEHLLLALLDRPGSPTSAVLARFGLTHDAVTRSLVGSAGSSDLDADALTTLGIDLDAVRTSVEAAFGSGALDGPRREPGRHIPFSPRAKKVLQLALREAIVLDQKSISDGHIALGLLREGQGLAMKVLADLGVDVGALRRDVQAALS
ncbi:Clp protease N-terminal domain-containing protein [Blastococcus jejuensis]